MFKKDKKVTIRESKKPKSLRRHVGIEIEFFCDDTHERLADKFIKAKLDNYVTLKYDGSVRAESGMHAHELNIICLESEYKKIVKKVCAILKDANSDVNSTCGLHVHLDMRMRNPKTAFSNLVAAQPILYAMNPKSRANNNFCVRTEYRDMEDAYDEGRTGINPHAFEKYKTIEVRIHAGTVNARKIINWIELLISISKKKEEIKRETKTVKGLMRNFKIDTRLESYIYNRMSKHKNDTD